MEKFENEIEKQRKQKKRDRKQELENEEQLERERRNEEKKKKQENAFIKIGHVPMTRSNKRDLKPKQKTDEKPSQDVVDQLRYLGEKLDQPAN